MHHSQSKATGHILEPGRIEVVLLGSGDRLEVILVDIKSF
jgi:uncharacterized protein